MKTLHPTTVGKYYPHLMNTWCLSVWPHGAYCRRWKIKPQVEKVFTVHSMQSVKLKKLLVNNICV